MYFISKQTKKNLFFFTLVIGTKKNDQLDNLQFALQHQCCAKLRLQGGVFKASSEAQTRLPQTKGLADVLSSPRAEEPLSPLQASTNAATALG